jgi:uncharacterized protein
VTGLAGKWEKWIVMFSLQKLLGKDDRFFRLLESAAEEARHSVLLLNQVLAHPDMAPALDGFIQARRAEKKIAAQIGEMLVQTFVTALEREDIELLSEALYKIPKTVEKFAERFSISIQLIQGVSFARHIQLLEAATQQVVLMVKELQDMGAVRLDKVKEMNARLQEIEGEADDLIIEILQDLWSGRHETTKVIVLKDLYELLEKVVDRCRDAGKTVTQIVLKNS